MLKWSSCLATKVPSSGACGWNTTRSQHVAAGNSPSSSFLPTGFTKDPLHPSIGDHDGRCQKKAVGWLDQFRSEAGWGLPRIWPGDFLFLSSFCLLRPPLKYLCPSTPFYFRVLWVSLDYLLFYWLVVWALWGQAIFFSFMCHPSLWHIIPTSYKYSCWMLDT